MMGKKVLAAKSGRAACSCAAAGGGIAAKNAKDAKSISTGLTGFTGLREASVKPAKTKPSGVAWIGDIPEGWEVCFLSQKVSQVRNRNYGLKEKNLLSLSYGKIKRKSIESIGGLLPASFEGYNVIAADDIVLRLTDLQNDQHSLRVGLSHEQGIVTSAYTTIRPNAETNAMYLYYLLFAFDIVKGFYGMGSGVRQGLNYDEVKRIAIVVPPLPVQRAIAAYLDEKCGAIDAAVAEAKKGIEEYKAWKKSLIFEVVTGKRRVGFFNAETRCARDEVVGLPERSEPEGPQGAARRRVAEKMKSSGIPWIGDVPEGWKARRLRYIATSFRKGAGITKADVIENGDVACIRYGDIYSKYKNDVAVIKCVSRTNANLISTPQRIFKGDILFSCTGELIEEIGKNIAYMGEDECFAGGDIIIVGHTQNPVFLSYVLNSYAQTQKSYDKTKLKVVHISTGNIKNLLMYLPPIVEQRAIADYLDEKCSAIDAMIAEKEALITDLEAYKKSLIYEVVTGKREMR